MQAKHLANPPWWSAFDVTTLSPASKFLMLYGALMWLACGLTYVLSLNDARALREVGI